MAWFRNLRLVAKLAIPAVLLLMVALGIMSIARFAIAELEQNTRQIVEVNAARAIKALQMGLAVDDATINEKNIIIETDAAAMAVEHKKFKDARERAFTAVDELIILADTPTRRAMNEGIKSVLNCFLSAAARSLLGKGIRSPGPTGYFKE